MGLKKHIGKILSSEINIQNDDNEYEPSDYRTAT